MYCRLTVLLAGGGIDKPVLSTCELVVSLSAVLAFLLLVPEEAELRDMAPDLLEDFADSRLKVRVRPSMNQLEGWNCFGKQVRCAGS
jgi:hypothetical protein